MTYFLSCLQNHWSDFISIGIALLTLVVTISIPIQVMKYQRYTNLMVTYMGFDMAHAFKSVIDFFHDDCKCNVEKIPEKYLERFKKDFKPKDSKDTKCTKDTSNILHYQRRLLNDYFFELEKCRESSGILRRKIEREWTSSEAWVVKVLIFMNATVDNEPEIYKDISCIKYERIPRTKGMSKHLEKLYNDLRKSHRWIQ